MNAQLDTLVRQYATARDTYENSQIGPRTDKALARMDALLARADKLGLGDELCKALGH